LKTYRVDVGDYAWFLNRAPESKLEWLDTWLARNIPEQDVYYRLATEHDVQANGNLYVWKLTNSWNDDDLGENK
jgi:hypothetical protein